MIRKDGGQRRGDRQGTLLFMIFVSNLFSYFLTLPHTLNKPSTGNLFRFGFHFSDFLGRLQPSKTTIQMTRGTLRVEESSYPRKVLHFYSSNSSRGRMRAELWRFKVSSKVYPCDLVSRLEFRRFSSPIANF